MYTVSLDSARPCGAPRCMCIVVAQSYKRWAAYSSAFSLSLQADDRNLSAPRAVTARSRQPAQPGAVLPGGYRRWGGATWRAGGEGVMRTPRLGWGCHHGLLGRGAPVLP